MSSPARRGCQQRRVVAVGAGRDQVQRQAGPLGHDRALAAPAAAIHRRAPGHLAAARCPGDAPVDRQVIQLQPEHPIVRCQGQRMDLLAQPGRRPLLEPPPDRRIRAAGARDPLVPRAGTNAAITCSNTTRSATRARWQPTGSAPASSRGTPASAAPQHLAPDRPRPGKTADDRHGAPSTVGRACTPSRRRSPPVRFLPFSQSPRDVAAGRSKRLSQVWHEGCTTC